MCGGTPRGQTCNVKEYYVAPVPNRSPKRMIQNNSFDKKERSETLLSVLSNCVLCYCFQHNILIPRAPVGKHLKGGHGTPCYNM